ncbi:uncharacterized protein LOC109598263 [Aethina tumida]|uniref:uncharacterized protein LOC109598263 n=1 Tax=Aethina tumida TaxID=116153 RepID=UPI00096B01D4|nr:uncharacterized protein LOC109598263 [Aethina tumida]
MDPNIIVGPELERVVEGNLGELLLLLLKTSEENVIQIDATTGEKLLANELLVRAIKLAEWFKMNGIGVGDSVTVSSENRLEFCIVPVAAFFVGATFAPINPDYTPRELLHVLSLSKPKVMFCSARTISKMLQVQNDHPYLQKLILFGNETKPNGRVELFNDIIRDADPENIDEAFEAADYDPNEVVATILCSSGTTGMPKGVMCTHASMTAYVDIARAVMKDMVESEDPSDAMMGLVPFFHSFGFMLMFLNVLRGKTMIVLSKFHTKVFLEAIVKYKITRLIVPPPVLLILLKNPLTKNYDLSHIKEIRSGAAPLGKDMEQELKDRFKVKNVSQSYGMTETTLGILMTPPGAGKLGSSGKIVPGCAAKIIDEKGNTLGANKEGELCFRGPLIMKGYVGDPEATANTIDADGWLHTGDVAYYDDEGYFFIVDRLKELIKYKGFQVAPAELEALLITHPSVQDAAVIGLPNDEAGELPLAYVVKKSGKTVTQQEIEKFVEDAVSPQKRLRGGVIFVEEIPRNATGKILRRVLKERAVKQKSKL